MATIADITRPFDDSGASFQVGLAKVTTVLPAGQVAMTGLDAPNLPAFAANAAKRMPKTNSWWTSLLWKKESYLSSQLVAAPLSFTAETGGLKVGYADHVTVSPFKVTDADHASQTYAYDMGGRTFDLRVGTEGLAATRTEVLDYSDWSVVAVKHNTGTRTVLSQNGNVLALSINGHSYGLFAPTGAAWTYDVSQTSYFSDLAGKDYLSLALLPDTSPQTLEFFRRRAFAWITGTRVDLTFEESPAARVRATYAVDTQLVEQGPDLLNQTVLALFRHQWLHTAAPVLPFTYVSPRGTMKVVDGNTFETRVDHHGILPCMPAFASTGPGGFSREDQWSLVDQAMRFLQSKQVDSTGRPLVPIWKGLVGVDSNTYWGAKPLLKLAKLAEVADLVGHRAAFDLFLGYLKSIMEYRFAGNGAQQMYYDRTWRTLIGFPTDFGANLCNDHHFHYGYFVQAAATVARFDPSWASPDRWGGMINLMIRDAGGPSRDDPRFPFLRCFDIYEGHSWAGGAQSRGSQNQESSSESMNFSCGVYQWGAETGNRELRDLGVCLWVTERTAIAEYWFDVSRQVFPAGFLAPTAGQVWGTGVVYNNYWGGTVYETHGINMVPINRGSLYLGLHPDDLRRDMEFMDAHQANQDVWFENMSMVRAMYDPASAIAKFNAKTDIHPAKLSLYGSKYGASDDPATTYHWIHNLNQLGATDTGVLADTPSYQVFANPRTGMRTYVAYNADKALPRTVTFTDGLRLVSIPPGQIHMASVPLPTAQ